ncbi:hypothetical protein TMatcc_004807 [Talaromyces marneffei ATCC 18224]|uniref:Serine palmitoyltransferase small subunit A n=2 Tax=Talaromyces marneffei TaxID=37727 RepID=B6Q2F4_TALMQ|nr:uncharacterized protein EYB26_000273 [Talaromyces marneffei]EEA26911.1 conserved hypothetical protein [Talaromyces marneffei ATCC 18224]EEA26912.1 conserved hypothetical protein [Talaromyces marneffei ATCC 18224]KAE8557354.1 hypothetical protein EYB25_002061 [Talaromyces marneffei]QGA12629.1 hypothetical protein EYB26_000273 [Talaromyces marneffei]
MAVSPSPGVFTSFLRWLRLKNYQYEVTFALYMLTPTEKFIFNFIVLTIVSLFCTAAYVYLPDHVAQIYGHVHYYFTADVSMIKEYIPSASSILQGNGGPAATGALNVMYEAASTAGLDEL